MNDRDLRSLFQTMLVGGLVLLLTQGLHLLPRDADVVAALVVATVGSLVAVTTIHSAQRASVRLTEAQERREQAMVVLERQDRLIDHVLGGDLNDTRRAEFRQRDYPTPKSLPLPLEDEIFQKTWIEPTDRFIEQMDLDLATEGAPRD